MLLAALGASGGEGQANCTRTLSGTGAYNDSAYSETSMSYSWSGGSQPKWFGKTVGKWNKCKGPSMSTGTAGDSKWTVKFSSSVPAQLNGQGACSYTDVNGDLGSPRTIYLYTTGSDGTRPRCSTFKASLLHELGHSLGLFHDGPGCPTTVMVAQPFLRGASWWAPYSVSNVNCSAVERFKREKKARDDGNTHGGGGGDPEAGNPGNGGGDPMSRCAADPNNCEEVDAPMTCSGTSTSEWDSTTNTWSEVTTVVCTY